MGKLIVTEFVSLDGVIEDPGGAEASTGGWAFQFDRGEAGNTFKFEELMEAEASLLGRRTYEGFAEAWPSRTDEAGFADRMNGMPKYVVSKTLKSADWNNSTISQAMSPRRSPRSSRARAGTSSPAAHSRHALTEDDLVDEYRLMVFPLVLGRGKRLFGDPGEARALR